MQAEIDEHTLLTVDQFASWVRSRFGKHCAIRITDTNASTFVTVEIGSRDHFASQIAIDEDGRTAP